MAERAMVTIKKRGVLFDLKPVETKTADRSTLPLKSNIVSKYTDQFAKLQEVGELLQQHIRKTRRMARKGKIEGIKYEGRGGRPKKKDKKKKK